MRARSFLILALASAALPAHAEAVSDAATGLRLDAPAGYTARKMPPGPGQGARIEVKAPLDKDTGCQIVYTAAPQNNGLSQAEIDTLMQGDEWLGVARATLERFYDIRSTQSFTTGQQGGVIMTGDFKERPELPPRAREIRTLFVIQETPRGRTTTVCVGDREGFGGRESEFLAVAAGVTPP